MIAEIGNEVVYGAPLDAVARRSSHDFLASEGGQQGWTTKGSLASEALDKALFELPLNELSDVIETPVGFHIVRVLERTEAGAKPFRDAQVEIKETLTNQRNEKRFDDYLTKLRSEIPIELIDKSIELPERYLIR
jgi:parvulin-like peptidyl-prolyl isomerase